MSVSARKATSWPYYAPDLPRPLVIAHQGGDGIWPSNTLFAFQQAAALGVDVMETDMHSTRDGVLVFSHDETVDRLSDGAGRIRDMTLAELKKLDAAYRWSPDGGSTFPYRGQGIPYPTVEEVFQALPDMRFNIDIKQLDPPLVEDFCRLIRRCNMQDRVLAASFHDRNMAAFRALCPEVVTAGAQNETRDFFLLQLLSLGRLYRPAFQALQVPLSVGRLPIVTRRFVRAAHQRGLRVDPWTVDDPHAMRRLIEMGVDGIITDRPDILMRIVGR
jgi:glycerophosphoryl diester phosphodiesterase